MSVGMCLDLMILSLIIYGMVRMIQVFIMDDDNDNACNCKCNCFDEDDE